LYVPITDKTYLETKKRILKNTHTLSLFHVHTHTHTHTSTYTHKEIKKINGKNSANYTNWDNNTKTNIFRNEKDSKKKVNKSMYDVWVYCIFLNITLEFIVNKISKRENNKFFQMDKIIMLRLYLKIYY